MYKMLHSFQKSSASRKVRFPAETSPGEGKTDLPLPTDKGMCKLMNHSCLPTGHLPVNETCKPSQLDWNRCVQPIFH